MSKYYKEEDIIKAIESADTFTMWQEQFAINTLKSLPSIEAEDDCVDRYSVLAELDPLSYEYKAVKELPSVIPPRSDELLP